MMSPILLMHTILLFHEMLWDLIVLLYFIALGEIWGTRFRILMDFQLILSYVYVMFNYI